MSDQSNKASKSQEPPSKKTKHADEDKDDVIYKWDPSYKFYEPPITKLDDKLSYTPVDFLRTHSKNNDPADVQTQIWQCSFEPDPEDPTKYTDVVATCGGNSVCFISVKTSEILLKYIRKSKGLATQENLYSLAWTSIPLDDLGLKRMNVLATGGGKSTVILIHPAANCCYEIFKTQSSKAAVSVCSLLFHPRKATWLFCGHDDGHIELWDIGLPTLPDYNVEAQPVLTIPPFGDDVYNMVYSYTNDLLICGCDEGLFAWRIDLNAVNKGSKLNRIEFEIEVPEREEHATVVDSISLIRDNILALKCALHGSIYLFNIEQSIKDIVLDNKILVVSTVLKSDSFLKLKWSNTDNFYMNMGTDPRSCLLVCGDDKGVLWVYNLAEYVNGEVDSPLFGCKAVPPLEHTLKIDWPELVDPQVTKAGKLQLKTNAASDIVVDKCTVSPGGEYIVAVTSNNMVCTWKLERFEKQNNN